MSSHTMSKTKTVQRKRTFQVNDETIVYIDYYYMFMLYFLAALTARRVEVLDMEKLKFVLEFHLRYHDFHFCILVLLSIFKCISQLSQMIYLTIGGPNSNGAVIFEQ